MKSLYNLPNGNIRSNAVNRARSNMFLRRIYQTKVNHCSDKDYKEGLHIRSISGQILKNFGKYDKHFVSSVSSSTKYRNEMQFRTTKLADAKKVGNVNDVKRSQSRIRIELKGEQDFCIGLLNRSGGSKKLFKPSKLYCLGIEYARKLAYLKNYKVLYKDKDEWNLTGVITCAKLNTRSKKIRSCSSQKATYRRYLTSQNFKPSTNINKIEFFIPNCQNDINNT